jgi:hypothetical protein
MDTAYNDNWGSCKNTHASLCIYPERSDPNRITKLLGISPTESQIEGESGAKITAWFLESEHTIKSKDIRRHLDWLLEQLVPRQSRLDQLRSEGADIFISCFWSSSQGHGGPVISPKQCELLAKLKLELAFDVY